MICGVARRHTAPAAATWSATLPWPPSVNRYWRSTSAGVLISAQGRAYRKAVAELLVINGNLPAEPLRGPLAMRIWCCAPDARRRDLDNLAKAPLDALQAAAVYTDDVQISRLVLVRKQPVHRGSLVITIAELLAEVPDHA